ncbi:MAG: hypothetical protein O2856_09820 [Planctomycetota bacterium]|nr:hypothetical protein [Planctomycetota bacterium]
MAKWFTVTLVATLLFCAGLYAGHRVPFANGLAIEAATQLSSGPLREDRRKVGNAIVEPDSPENAGPFSFASRETPSTEVEFHTAELNEQDTTEARLRAISDGERAAIRNLIQRQFPDMTAELTEIWVETYAGTDLEEIGFILEQKRATTSRLTSGSMFFSTIPPTSLASGRFNKSEHGLDDLVDTVERNLRSAYSLGYRRMAVFPEAAGDPQSSSVTDPIDLTATRFRSFEAGPLLTSPIATHVALIKESFEMFSLEGGRLTRRGDFQILKDRRLGIVTSRGEIAAAESTPLPVDATDVRIAQSGTVEFQNAAGETCEAGRIAVCIVINLAGLQSSDGVIFTASDAGKLPVCADASAFLKIQSLEQSNVDRNYEKSLLEHLKSSSHSSLSP